MGNSLSELIYDVRRVAQNREKLTEKKIEAIYNSLMYDLNAFVSKEYVKYADSDGRLFLSYLDSKNQRAKFLNEIVKNVDGISPKLKKEMMELVDDTYKKTYQGMIEAVKNAETDEELKHITKDLSVDSKVLKQAVNNNISKLTLNPVMEKHRQELVYQIQQELSIGLMNGDRYETMAKRLMERIGVSKSKANNIVRTESHRNTESGLLDGAKQVQEKLGNDAIYAVTWMTMQDQRVRPQQRRRTAKGWKTTISKNGANHMKMDGTTIKVGEKFKLETNVFAEAPGMSGTARNDCNCRCKLKYELMTPEQFAKATGHKVAAGTKIEKAEKIELQLDNFPVEFTKGAEGKNTQKLVDYINSIEDADPNALKLYASTGKLENLSSNGIGFKISHAKSHAVQTTSNRFSGGLIEVKYTVPKLKGENIAGQVNTTLHEQMHLLDLYGREDAKKYNKWFSSTQKSLKDTFSKTSDSIGDDITELFAKHNVEYYSVRDSVQKAYDKKISSVKEKYLPNGMSPWEDMKAYRAYEKEAKKLRSAMIDEIDYQARNIMGGGIGNLQDIYDALSSGSHRANGVVIYGHGQQYYADVSQQIHETVANYASLSVTRPDLIKMLRKDKPELCAELDNMIVELTKKAGG